VEYAALEVPRLRQLVEDERELLLVLGEDLVGERVVQPNAEWADD
jgi:hypothetical protein